MLALIDGETLWNSFGVGWGGIFPARVELLKLDQIRPVPYTLFVDIWMKGALGTELAGCLQHVEGAKGVDFEAKERNRGSATIGGLRSGVDDNARPRFLHHAKHRLAVADVQGLMPVVRDFTVETRQNTTCISFRAKEIQRGDCYRSRSREIPGERRRPTPRNRQGRRNRSLECRDPGCATARSHLAFGGEE
jgi:hypothetical protein